MKYIRFASDLHLDFDIARYHRFPKAYEGVAHDLDALWYPEPMEGDDDTVFVIPGDLWIERRFISRKHPLTGKSWLATMADRFKHVVFVLGNHDYWGQNFGLEPGRVKMALNDDKLANVSFLENTSVVIDQVKFLGGTLWTDFAKQDPLVMIKAQSLMNDYKYIRNGPGYRKLYPAEVLAAHLKARNFIMGSCVKDDPTQRVMVVTHMAPSFQSYENYDGARDSASPYYASDLSELILEDTQAAEWWVHGHIHSTADYMIGDTRIMCNPRGYVGQATRWDPKLRIEL